MKISIVHKLSLSAMFLVLLSTSMVGAVFFYKTSDVLVGHALDDISEKVANAGNRLQLQVETYRQDALYLSKTPPIQGMLRAIASEDNYDRQGKSSYQQWVNRLELIFVAILKTKPSYLRLRFIDKNGQELIVAAREGGVITILGEGQLQNKAQRSYMRNTLRLQEGEVYLSDINLNREYGKVSIPHQEVLRSATPVYNEKNAEIEGVILINAEVGHELRNIRNSILDLSQNIYITNDRGGYLLHPDEDKTYGFDLGKRYRIQEDIPQLANLFLPGNRNKTFILQESDGDVGNVVNFSKIYFDPSEPERFITVGMTQPYRDILQKQSAVLDDVLKLVFFLVVGVMLVAIMLSLRISAPIKRIIRVMDDYSNNRISSVRMPIDNNDEIGLLARSYETLIGQVESANINLREMNRNLEVKVYERTKELESSEVRQRSIIDQMVDGFITIDEKGTIGLFTSSAEKIFGYKSDEVLGHNINMLMPEPYHSEHDGYLDNYNRTGHRKIIGIGREVTGRRKDGSEFPMDLAISEMVLDGQKVFTGVVRDITERKLVEKLKNEFISTVSHELRTPLTAIRGSLGLITGGAVGELPDQIVDMLRIAGNNTERLLILINDILDIQKIESGQIAFKFERVELMPLLEQVIENTTTFASQFNVSFSISTALANSYIYADKDRMMQVMENLLSNAAKFSPENEVVEISVARHYDDSIRVSVTDHGEGIPEEFQSKLFSRFTQSDSSSVRKKGGTGLGLSIAKAIVEKHGGIIDFVTRVGVGSTFYIELPEFVGDALSSNDDSFRQLPKQHQQCVLIVEDDPDIAALIRRMLAEDGYNSDIALNVREARQYMKQNQGQYKAITLDLVLPDESGIRFLEDIRREADTHDIPVIVVSAEADEAKRDLVGGAMGVVDWLRKPIDQQRLVDAVKHATSPSGLPRVLHVEDEEDVHAVVSVMLKDYCELSWTATFVSSEEALKSEHFDLVLLDIGLPDGSGLDLLETIDALETPPKVVIFSAYDVSKEHADKVSAVLMKSKTDNTKLAKVIKSAIESKIREGNYNVSGPQINK